MNSNEQHLDDFTLKGLLNNLRSWFSFLSFKTKDILKLSFFFLLLTFAYNYIKSPIHYARTSFVLDSESSSNSIGDIASLASLAGINASSFIDASSLFQIDNIQELYRSSSMLKQTLLTKSTFGNEKEMLINRFGREEKITSIVITENGNIQATYGGTNSVSIGKIGLASFSDPNRLTPIGANLFRHSRESGLGILGVPAAAGRGKIHSGALEMANTNITEELSNMIRAQQAFSGSSRLLQSEAEMVKKLI